MYEIFKNVLKGDYELVDMLNKIAEYYIKGNLSKEEKEELEDEARNNANPENSYAPLKTQLNEAFERIKSLEDRMSVLEGIEPEEPSEPGTGYNKEDFKEFVQPSGAHDCYNTGDKVKENYRYFVAIQDGIVWAPSVYPAAWNDVTEQVLAGESV